MSELIAKKKFGQNFLVNSSIQFKVVDSLSQLLIDSNLPILEIGPGKGHITKHLLELNRPVVALEIDPEAVEWLKQTEFVKNSDNLELILADALELFTNQTLPLRDFVLFSSLPYNVGSRILVEMAVNYPNNSFCVIIQKEVAHKVLSGRSSLSFFGAFLNLLWNFSKPLDIAPGNFDPVPKVWSSVLVATPKFLPEYLDNGAKRAAAKEIIKKLFAAPNKTLTNNLRAYGWSMERIEIFLAKLNLPATTRLDWTNYDFLISQIVKEINL